MIKRDYYQVLGLATDCTPQDIKKNYHKLALVWHPDKNANKSEAESKFTEIHEAYTILVDTKKRKEYDLYGHKDDSKDQCFARDFFYQKGFYGKDKSAFDVLQDIFDDNDDPDEEIDDFFDGFTAFGKMTDAFKTDMKSFIHENLMSSENEEADGFFESYTPTFMDTSFFNFPSLFKTQNDSDTQHAEFFSFFSSMDSDAHSFSKSSTTFLHKGKVKTSTKQRMQKGGDVYENTETQEYDLESSLKPEKLKKSKSTSKAKGSKKTKEVITIDDENNEEDDKPRRSAMNGKSKSSPLKKNKSQQSKRSEPETKSSKRDGLMFCMDDLIGGEFGLFADGDFEFLQKTCKRNKK